MAKVLKRIIISAVKGVEELTALYIAVSGVSWCNQFGNRLAVLKVLKIVIKRSSSATPSSLPKNQTVPQICTAASFIITKPGNNPNAHYLTNM